MNQEVHSLYKYALSEQINTISFFVSDLCAKGTMNNAHEASTRMWYCIRDARFGSYVGTIGL